MTVSDRLHPAIDPTLYRQVLAHYPTGVSVVMALGVDRQPIGMVIGSLTSVSLDPPLVGFLPDKNSGSWRQISGAKQFSVNVLCSDQQSISQQIAAKAADKFCGIRYRLGEHEVPIIENALIAIECAMHDICDAGDHWFVLGRVLKLTVMRDGDPLIFHRGRYGGFGEIA